MPHFAHAFPLAGKDKRVHCCSFPQFLQGTEDDSGCEGGLSVLLSPLTKDGCPYLLRLAPPRPCLFPDLSRLLSL